MSVSGVHAEAVAWRCSIKKGALKHFAKFTGKHLCQSFFFNKVTGLRLATLLKKRPGTGVSCEICEISKNNFSYRTHPVAASSHAIGSRSKAVFTKAALNNFTKFTVK